MSGLQFTEKTEKTLGEAASLAKQNSHVNVTPIHIACALLNEEVPSGQTPLINSVVNKAGGDPAVLNVG